MRSPGSRLALERALRAASIALVLLALWRALAPVTRAGRAQGVDERALAASLAAWTRSPFAESVHVSLDSVPDRVRRDWLVALRRAGVHVSWSGATLPPLAIDAEPVNDPLGGVRVAIAAPARATARLADDVGPLDSLALDAPAAALRVATASGALAARVDGQTARAVPRDSLAPRGIVVLGRAGWEAKFVIAALEERGWRVSARLRVAPGIDVTQGTPIVLDTARTAAVIVLDTSAAATRGIASFVRSGGGLVLAGDAARAPPLAAIAPGAVGARVAPASISFASDQPRRALSYFPVTSLAAEALPIELRDGRVVAAARRVGAGRVVQLGYDESWRWRLEGSDAAPDAHRAFWSGVVASVGYRAARPLAIAAPGDAAPLAALHDALGAPVAAPPIAVAATRTALPWWLLALLLATLLGEWSSRRLRGAP